MAFCINKIKCNYYQFQTLSFMFIVSFNWAINEAFKEKNKFEDNY